MARVAKVVEAVAVGTEILLGQIANTNGQLLAKVLAEHGALHYFQVTVGDNRRRLVETLRQALSRADIVVTIGGLGPTQDDLTKEAVAEVFGRGIVIDEPSWAAIVQRFAGRGRPTPNNRRQAEIPEGAVAIPNGHGTAPGVLLEADYQLPAGPAVPRVVICLPGPPGEFGPMVRGFVADYLEQVAAGPDGARTVLVSRSLRVAGMGESQVEHEIRDLIDAATNPTIATYAKPGDVEVRITASTGSPAEAAALLRPLEETLRARLSPWVYGADADTLGSAVIRELSERGLTIAVAESCTGGLVAERLTEGPGASAAFVLGAVTYANRAKAGTLGVTEAAIEEHGSVSEVVAREMAEGVRARGQTAIGLAVTGIAGPDGGTAEKPVGTVFIALAAGDGTWCRRLALSGDRAAIRWRTAQEALGLVRRYVLAGAAALG